MSARVPLIYPGKDIVTVSRTAPRLAEKHQPVSGMSPADACFYRRLILAIFTAIAIVALCLGFIWADSHRLAPCKQVVRECGFEGAQ
jgi:hypothetical protein